MDSDDSDAEEQRQVHREAIAEIEEKERKRHGGSLSTSKSQKDELEELGKKNLPIKQHFQAALEIYSRHKKK